MMQSSEIERIDRLAILYTQSKFYAEKKLSDVKIQIGDEVFPASRFMLASLSEFFERMFCSDFKESNPDVNTPIVLDEVDASAFKDILEAMSTGNILVSDSNVFALLRASHYLLLRSLYVEDKCYSYLVSNSSKVVSDAFDILTFAHLTGKKRFVDHLNVHILEHASHFLEDVRSLDIPVEALVGLLECRGGSNVSNAQPPLSIRGDALLRLVTSWINHSRQQRSSHRNKLMMMINPLSVSTKYALSLLGECENFIDETIGRNKKVVKLLPNLKPLVYVSRPADEFEIGIITWEVEYDSVMNLRNTYAELSSPSYLLCDEEWRIFVLPTNSYNNYHSLSYHKLNLQIRSSSNLKRMSEIRIELSIVAQSSGEKDLIQRGLISSENSCTVYFPQSDIVQKKKVFVKDNKITFKARIFL